MTDCESRATYYCMSTVPQSLRLRLVSLLRTAAARDAQRRRGLRFPATGQRGFHSEVSEVSLACDGGERARMPTNEGLDRAPPLIRLAYQRSDGALVEGLQQQAEVVDEAD